MSTTVKPLSVQVTYVVTWAQPLATLMPKVSDLAAALLDGLQPFGLRMRDLKNETKTQDPSDFLVTCYLHDFTCVVRVRLDSLEVWTNSPQSPESLPGITAAAIRTVQAVAPSAQMERFAIDIVGHGQMSEGIAVEVIGKLLRRPDDVSPILEPFGVVFRAALQEGVDAVIELQPSYVHPGPANIFAHLRVTFGHEPSMESAHTTVLEFAASALRRFGIEFEAPVPG